MKRKFVLLTLLMCILGGLNMSQIKAQETVTVGTINEYVYDNKIPTYTYYNYSYSQQIYTKDEMRGKIGNITKIAFKQRDEDILTRKIKIYMQNTTKTNFASATDWVDVTDADIVFEGEVDLLGKGKDFEITLDDPFDYIGENLLVSVCDYTGDCPSAAEFYTYETDSRSIYAFNDNNEYTPTNMSGIEGNIGGSANNVIDITIERVTPSGYCSIVFILNDSYGDGWNGGKLTVVASDGTNETLTLDDGSTATYTLDIKTGSDVTVTYIAGSYSYENLYTIKYKDGDNIRVEESTQPTYEPVTNFTTSCGPPILFLTISADKECIPTDGSVQLTAAAQNGTGNYTYTWSSVDGLTANNNTATFTPTTAGTYTFTCTVSDGETTATDDVTVTVYEKPNLAKQYRIKVYEGGYAGKYLHINSHTQPNDASTQVGVQNSNESNCQIFTLEEAGNNIYYIRDADGYYIKCDDRAQTSTSNYWSVYAYSETDKTPLSFEYVGVSNFYIRDYDKALGNGNSANNKPESNYFKVQSNNVYCDAPISNTDVVTWTLEEAIVAEPEKPSTPTNLTANASSYNTIDLSWNAVNGATSYNVYLKGSNSKIGSVDGTSFQVTGLDGEKEYCFTVTAVNSVGESDPSEEECTTTPAEPVGCKIIFELRAAGDYGWGANGALAVFYTGGPEDGDILGLTSGTNKTYSYIWTEGTELSVRLLTGSYPEEMGFTIKYENGVVIRNYNIGEISSSLNNNMFLYRHIVDCSLPVPNVIARAIGKSGIELTWDDINIANGYNVYDEESNLIAENLTESSLVIKGLNATSEYCFTVTAVYEDDEESEHSEEACATTSDSDVQEGVIGDGGESKEWIPIATYHKYSYSQQSYTKNEIANAGGAEGYISSVSYYVTSLGTTTNPRNLRVFLSNVDSQNEITFDRNTYQLISEDLVYEGPVTLTAGWVKINFQKPFKYNGNHIVITVIDDTGDTDYGDTYFSLHEKDENYKYWVVRGNSESKIDLTTSISGTNYAYRNDIKLSFVSEDVDIEFTGIGAWNDIDNWNVKFVPTADKDVIISGEAYITNDVTINSISMDGGSLTVEANNSLTINGNMTNDDASAFVIEDGAQVFQTNDNVLATFRMNIAAPTAWEEWNETGWQFISSPMKDATTAGFAPTTQDSDYDLFKYNGNVATPEDLEWVNYKGHKDFDFEAKFQQGQGYMASYKVAAIAEFAGVLNNTTSFDFSNKMNTSNANDYFANFYLLGNPFAFDMKWNNNNIAASGLAEGYAVVTTDGSYNYATTGDIKVGDGFFVKVTGTNPSLSYTANTRNRNVDENKYINLIASNKAGNDNVIINFADNGRDGFAKLKSFNEDIAEIYVKDNEKRYGILNYDEDIEEIDVYFNAKKIGYYTINAISNADFSNVTLIDRITGIETNILTDSYTFQATTNDSPERFIIRIDKETESENFVYKSGEELIINAKGCVQIIDVMGRIVYSNDIVNDNHRINISSFKNATYIVHVVNTNEVKTQKIVIW